MYELIEPVEDSLMNDGGYLEDLTSNLDGVVATEKDFVNDFV